MLINRKKLLADIVGEFPSLLLGLITFACSSLVAFHQQCAPQGGDPIGYLMAARHWPEFGDQLGRQHGWGYPGLIALLSAVLNDEYLSARLISIVSATLVTLCSVKMAFKYLRRSEAWLAGALIAIWPTLLDLGGGVNADILFTALVWLAYWLLFFRERTLIGASIAGGLIMCAYFTRGNGIVLVLIVPIILAMSPVQGAWRKAMAFVAGLLLTALVLAVVYISHKAPANQFVSHGVPEIAFAALDKTDNWLNRAYYDTRYPTLAILLRDEWRALLKSAARTFYHLYDWWLMPQLGILCFFSIPGILAWLRRWRMRKLGLPICVCAVQATYLFSGRFAEPRHLVASVPFLLLMSVYGLLLLPNSARFVFGKRSEVRLPVQRIVLVLVVGFSIVWSVVSFAHALRTPQPQRWKDMCEAGLWLRGRASSHDVIAASRANVAYYANVGYLDYTSFLGTNPPSAEMIPALLTASNCFWFAWIKGHSHYEYPSLSWLETTNSFGGCELVFRNVHVSIWHVSPDRSITDFERLR